MSWLKQTQRQRAENKRPTPGPTLTPAELKAFKAENERLNAQQRQWQADERNPTRPISTTAPTGPDAKGVK